MGVSEWEGTEPDVFGVQMHWSHFDSRANRAMVEAAGFSIELDEIDGTVPGERHQIILVRAA